MGLIELIAGAFIIGVPVLVIADALERRGGEKR